MMESQSGIQNLGAGIKELHRRGYEKIILLVEWADKILLGVVY